MSEWKPEKGGRRPKESGKRRIVPYNSLIYLTPAILFVIFHSVHTYIAFTRL
jgi:hypothetical protein